MQLTAIGNERRRGLVLILHDSSREATTRYTSGNRKGCAQKTSMENEARRPKMPQSGDPQPKPGLTPAGSAALSSLLKRGDSVRMPSTSPRHMRTWDGGRQVRVE